MLKKWVCVCVYLYMYMYICILKAQILCPLIKYVL